MASYVALGVRHELTLQPLQQMANNESLAMTVGPAGPRMMARPKAKSDADGIEECIKGSKILSSRVNDLANLTIVQGAVAARPNIGARRAAATPISTRSVLTLASETVIAEGLRQADFAAARDYGAKVIAEALDGKVLLQVDSVQRVFGLVDLLLKREVGSATPTSFAASLRSSRRRLRLPGPTTRSAWRRPGPSPGAVWTSELQCSTRASTPSTHR